MAKDTVTFEMEGVGTWEIPIPVATTIEGLANERVAFLARAEAAEAENARLREQVATLPQQIADAVSQMPREEQDDLVNVQDILNVIRGIAGPLAGGSLWFAAGEWEEIVGSAAEADDLREQVATLKISRQAEAIDSLAQ